MMIKEENGIAIFQSLLQNLRYKNFESQFFFRSENIFLKEREKIILS